MRSLIALLVSGFVRCTPFHRRKRSIVKRLLGLCRGRFVRSVHGFSMLSPGNDRTVAAAIVGDYQDVTSVIQELRPGMALLDVGANAGVMSLLASGRVGPNGLVLSFEPSLREFSQLAMNLQRNGCANVIPFMLAIGSRSGLVKFSVSSSAHSGLNHFSHDDSGVSIGCINPGEHLPLLRSLLGERRIMLKVDVEGAEMEVLRGLRDLLTSGQVDTIIIETKDAMLRRFGSTRHELYAFLDEQGYAPTRGSPEAPERVDNEVFRRRG